MSMRVYFTVVILLFINCLIYGQDDLGEDFSTIASSSFKSVDDNWEECGDVLWSFEDPDFERVISGSGVLVNHPTEKDHCHLITFEEYSGHRSANRIYDV